MSSNSVLSVQRALQQLPHLDGQLVQVEGVLEFERDGVALKIDRPLPGTHMTYIRLLGGHCSAALFRTLLSHLKHQRVQVIGLMRLLHGTTGRVERRRQPRASLDTLLILSL